MDLCKEVDVNMPDTVIERAHRIGIAYVSNKSKKCCKSMILRFTTFGHRIMVYRAKKNMKGNVRVKSDLEKKQRYNLITSGHKIVQNIKSVKFY